MSRRRKPLVRPFLRNVKRRRAMRKMRVHVAVVNAPESGKRGLIRDRSDRAEKLFDILDAHGVGIAIMQESGPHAQLEAFRRKGWHYVHATPNSHAWGSWQANAIAFRNDWFRPVGEARDITVDGLHQVSQLFEHRKSDFRFNVTGGHAPTKRVKGAFRTRAGIRSAFDRYVSSLRGAPVLLGIDANSGGYRVAGMRRILRQYVSHLLASVHWRADRRRVVNAPLISDHKILIARMKVRWVGTQLNRLPK